MRECEFNVGDIVVIKDYEEIVDEFGLFDSSCTDTPVFVFQEDNKGVCGQQITIYTLDYKMSPFREEEEECFVINNTDDMGSDFVITTDMVKLYKKTKDINSASQKDIDDFLV